MNTLERTDRNVETILSTLPCLLRHPARTTKAASSHLGHLLLFLCPAVCSAGRLHVHAPSTPPPPLPYR